MSPLIPQRAHACKPISLVLAANSEALALDQLIVLAELFHSFSDQGQHLESQVSSALEQEHGIQTENAARTLHCHQCRLAVLT